MAWFRVLPVRLTTMSCTMTATIQGRPDSALTISYYLTYCYGRCNRGVCIPAPVYYAHHAAFRARHYPEEADMPVYPLDWYRFFWRLWTPSGAHPAQPTYQGY
ncbi:hypothetical protein RvY_17588-3 [Ramazzottius varieornatus]|uniref:Piwi domain-containing protein n=1 Tax=Ramazzottius varieornatus TaxID=947166 RepID=A0A1D1W9K8_RAMVA|nr:hypothetical protein RvY_17588-3 [Ramazzottius varieornatus]